MACMHAARDRRPDLAGGRIGGHQLGREAEGERERERERDNEEIAKKRATENVKRDG